MLFACDYALSVHIIILILIVQRLRKTSLIRTLYEICINIVIIKYIISDKALFVNRSSYLLHTINMSKKYVFILNVTRHEVPVGV